jgi:hypothetical protein
MASAVKTFPEYELLEASVAAEERGMKHEAWHESSCLFACEAAKSWGGRCNMIAWCANVIRPQASAA